jgi:hypothetical protein
MLGDPWEELRREMGWGPGEAQFRQQLQQQQPGGAPRGAPRGALGSGQESYQESQKNANTTPLGERVREEPRRPVAPFYRTGGDGEQERKEWERARLLAEDDEGEHSASE